MATPGFSTRFLQSLPEGITAEDVHVVQCAASVVPVQELTPDEKIVLSSFSKAGPDSIVDSNGKPTVMRVVAWMCHEGVNDNRQMFVKEELETAAKDLFKAPHFGVMDFNHSAVLPWSEEPKVIGLWYKAEFAFDTKAKKWGILATGMLWSWLFPDHADKLLADQARRGYMRFSMAAIAGSHEYITAEDGKPATIIHNPVFCTVSALDVPPADPDAKGMGSEDGDEDDDQKLKNTLVAMAASHPWAGDVSTIVTSKKQGERMNDTEIIQQLTEDRVRAETALQDLVNTTTAEKAGFEAKIAELTAKIAELETTHEELTMARTALAQDRETLAAKVEELTAQITELADFKAGVEAAQAAAEQTARLASRIADLPENVRLIHARKTDEARLRVEKKWMGMSDEEWKVYLVEELLGYNPDKTVISYLDRSSRLPDVAGTDETDFSSIARSLLR